MNSVPHPLLEPLGCRIFYDNGEPEAQARGFLRSLRMATVQSIAGRTGPDLTDAEFKDWMRKLEEWEAAGNRVELPPPAVPSFRPPKAWLRP